MKRILSLALSLIWLAATLPLSASGENTPLLSDTSPDSRYALLGAGWDPSAADGDIVEKDGTYVFHFTHGAGHWMGITDAAGVLNGSSSVTYEYEILFDTGNGNDRCFLCFGDEKGWHGVNEGAPAFDGEGYWVSGTGFTANGHWGPVPKWGEWGTISIRSDHYDPSYTDQGRITCLGSWVDTGDLYLRSVTVRDNDDPDRYIQLRFNEPDQFPELRYTLEGAAFDPAVSDGEIVLLEDQYLFRFSPDVGGWIGIGDPEGILSGSRSVTYEYEVYFDTDNGNDCCFIGFGDENGWHGVSEGAPQFNEEGYWQSGTGFALSGAWGPVPPARTWGAVSVRNDHYDPSAVINGCITRLGSWVGDGDLYLRSVRVYDNDDPSKYISLRFNPFIGQPAPRYTLEGAVWDRSRTDGDIVSLNGRNVFCFEPPANQRIGLSDPGGILNGSVSVTYECEILFDTPNLNDRCFIAFGDVNGWHGVMDGAPAFDEEGYWVSGTGFVAHGSWGASPEVGKWGTVSIRNDHFDPSVTHNGNLMEFYSWMSNGNLYVRRVRIYDNRDESKYIALTFNEDLNELHLNGRDGAAQGEKEGYPVWAFPEGSGILDIDTLKLLADGTLTAGARRIAVTVNCWLEETEDEDERLLAFHLPWQSTGESGLCGEELYHDALNRRGRWCQYKFLLEMGHFYADGRTLHIRYANGAALYIRGVEVYAADLKGERISRRPSRWGFVEPDPELSFRWADNEDGTVKVTAYTGVSPEAEIPEYLYGKKVTALGNYAFFGNDKLEKVTIPDTVTELGDYAFGSCTALIRVDCGSRVESIGIHAFSMCTALEEIALPKGLISLGKSAFYGCESLRRIALPEGTETVGAYAFAWCGGLDAIALPGTVTSIGEGAFRGCGDSLTIRCPSDSVPLEYALENRIPYILTDAAPMGDADGDGEITSTDARLVLMAAVGRIGLSDLPCPQAAEVDGDGETTSTDARLILQFSAGKIADWPPTPFAG